MSLAQRQYVNAMASFLRNFEGDWKLLKANVSGILQQDGTFIFYLDSFIERLLVMTTNDGQVITAGQLVDHTDISWMQLDTWKTTKNLTIVDFQGFEGINRFYFCLILYTFKVELGNIRE